MGSVSTSRESAPGREEAEGGRTGSQDDKLANTTVQRLCCLVGTLLQLVVVRCLLDEVEDLVRELGVGEGEGLGVGCGGCVGHFGVGLKG